MIPFGMVFAIVSSSFLVMMLTGQMEGEGDIWVGYVVSGMFVIVGLGVSVSGFFHWRKSNKAAAMEARHPDAPWMTQKDWASGRIRDSSASATFAMLFFAAFWNAISWTIAIVAWRDEAADTVARYFVLLFPGIGILVAASAIYQVLRWLKFGSSTFEMAEVPGRIGGSLGGLIKTKAGVYPRDGIDLSLKCIHQTVTGSGKSRRTQEDIVWEATQAIPQDQINISGAHTFIPVYVEIPPDSGVPTVKQSDSEQYFWRLEAKAEVSGVDYQSSYVVPVYHAENRPM